MIGGWRDSVLVADSDAEAADYMAREDNSFVVLPLHL